MKFQSLNPVVTIKMTQQELELAINSLEMSISTIVPCVNNGGWKIPYEALKKDLVRVNLDLNEAIREKQNDIKKEDTVTLETETSPGPCD